LVLAELPDEGMTTGGSHAFLSSAAADATSSVRETPMPSTPLKPASVCFPDRLDVRFA